MRIRVTSVYRSYHIELIRAHMDSVRTIMLLDKDEKFKRDHFMLCSGLLKLYFPEIRKLNEYKTTCEFDDRGFFKVFPEALIGKITS